MKLRQRQVPGQQPSPNNKMLVGQIEHIYSIPKRKKEKNQNNGGDNGINELKCRISTK